MKTGDERHRHRPRRRDGGNRRFSTLSGPTTTPTIMASDWGYFTPEWLTTVFTIVLASATVALVWTSIEQHRDAVNAIETTKRLAQATEDAASERQQIASADFIFKINAMLEDHRYDRIVDDIQSHNSDYRLPTYPNRTDANVEEYIGMFEDVGYFITENLISAKMAYDHFSYEIEKAWCNVTVRETIQQVQATDRSKTAQSDPLYGNFEKLAKEYLDNEGQRGYQASDFIH
jgi:hypothetical protein